MRLSKFAFYAIEYTKQATGVSELIIRPLLWIYSLDWDKHILQYERGSMVNIFGHLAKYSFNITIHFFYIAVVKFRTQVFMISIPFWRKIISYHIFKYIKHLKLFVSNFTNTSYNTRNGIYKRRICCKYHIKFKITLFIWNSNQYNCYKTTYPLLLLARTQVKLYTLSMDNTTMKY